ncbi:CMRF35-like molecule 6 isoform X2 [Chelonia mydas]|uniref:CMRF35-like molecule 6 isoform X2 n=1 Tax=Chelonia mydas TaxID=8469 RepID=UPI001CA80B30|nr:CMRF35-like molecule 6 isoform X2 [Chelonia mydas]
MRLFPILGWMLFPGCWAVTGPGAVDGPLGGSVAVRCRYSSGSEKYPKFWCRKGGFWEGGRWRCSNGLFIVETSGSEAEVRRGRVSIRDNHTELAFTVTVENLTRADAGMYHCGVGREWLYDPRATVELTVSPANYSPTSRETSSSATVQPTASSPSISTSLGTNAEKGISSFYPGISTNHDTTASESQDSDILFYVLIPCVLLVLILLLLAAVMLVRLSKKRKKALSGASVQKDKKINLSNLAVGNNAAGGSPEYAVIDSPAATDQTGFYSNVETPPNSDCNYAEIQPHCQGSEEVSYAMVTISTPDQQPIYANVEQRPKKTCPAKPPEETLYSAVKKPTKH